MVPLKTKKVLKNEPFSSFEFPSKVVKSGLIMAYAPIPIIAAPAASAKPSPEFKAFTAKTEINADPTKPPTL